MSSLINTEIPPDPFVPASALITAIDHDVVVSLRGEFDATTAQVMRDTFKAALALDPKRFEVDMYDVTFLDSTGLGALIRASANAAESGCTFSVTRPSSVVRRLLQVTDLYDTLVAAP